MDNRITKVRDLDPLDFPQHGFDVVQPKIDGWHCRMEVKKGGEVLFTSRNGLVIKRRAAPADAIDFVAYGELIHGTEWAEQSGRMGEFVLFDCERYPGASYMDRLRYAKQFLDMCPMADVSIVETLPVGKKLPSFFWDYFVRQQGYEGLVFRHANDAEPRIWRLKDKVTADYYVTRIFSGPKGATLAGLAKTVGGDEIGTVMIPGVENPRVDACIEVEGQQLLSSGLLRSPVYSRLRPDKDPCQFSRL